MTANRTLLPTPPSVTRRTVVRTGARLVYAAPLVAASFHLGVNRAGAQPISGGGLCAPGDLACGAATGEFCCGPDAPVCCPTIPVDGRFGACCGEEFAGEIYGVCCPDTLGGACCPDAAPVCCPETCCEVGQTCGPDGTCLPAAGISADGDLTAAVGVTPRLAASAR